MYFLTVWLKKEDSEEHKEHISSIIEEYVKKYCKSEVLKKKISSSGTRITVTLPCDSSSYNCTQQHDTIIDLISELETKINRVARAKAACIED